MRCSTQICADDLEVWATHFAGGFDRFRRCFMNHPRYQYRAPPFLDLYLQLNTGDIYDFRCVGMASASQGRFTVCNCPYNAFLPHGIQCLQETLGALCEPRSPSSRLYCTGSVMCRRCFRQRIAEATIYTRASFFLKTKNSVHKVTPKDPTSGSESGRKVSIIQSSICIRIGVANYDEKP